MHTLTYHIQHQTVHVDLGISLSEWLAKAGNLVVVTDQQVNEIHGEKWKNHPVIALPKGESAKSQKVCFKMLEQLLDWEITSDYTIVGIGGGVVTDMAGFLASIYKRGLPLVLVPTTLLAMVDASLGGKNGINAHNLKNMIGTVYQPQRICFDFDLLKSLPHEEWVNGMAEIIKHAWIADLELLLNLEQSDWNEIKNNPSFLIALVKRNIDIKMNIVAQDPSDKKERRWLNFGHTIGHAIERQLSMAHGKAVALGMMAAINYSGKINGSELVWDNRMRALLIKYDLPVYARINTKDIYNAVLQDKKRSATHLNLVLLREVAQPFLLDIPVDSLLDVVNEMLIVINSNSENNHNTNVK